MRDGATTIAEVTGAGLAGARGRGRASPSVFEALLDARRRFGRDTPILEDAERKPLTYGKLITAAVALGRTLARETAPGEAVGVLLPNANAVAVTILALHAFGRVPAMLNYTMGAEALTQACAMAGVRTIVTARRFVALARLDRLVEALGEVATIRHLEDVRPQVRLSDKLWGVVAAYAPALAPGGWLGGRTMGDQPGFILFTSGSEGTPKGVVLSHANVLANCRQITATVKIQPSDTVLSPLPVFHTFGLTGGLMLPLLNGVRACLYPSPLHYRNVADLCQDLKATVLFGTDTFLAGYARAADGQELSSLRLAVAGAEPVRESTRTVFRDRFGVLILEGYGATETAPVLAVNTPEDCRSGTVGRLLPEIEHRLEEVPGVKEGGRLLVRGPNVMLGYLLPDRPCLLHPPSGGWHDTGDVVTIDSEGFVRIIGRVRRFAKIAGEMVSLAAVEGLAAALWPQDGHAAIALPDPRRGERIVLMTTRDTAAVGELSAFARDKGASALMVPGAILAVEAIPSLGSGKTDYAATRRMAETALAPQAAGFPQSAR